MRSARSTRGSWRRSTPPPARPGSTSGPGPTGWPPPGPPCAGGLVEPATAIPDAVRRAAPYPLELFRIQATYLEQKEPELGGLGGPQGVPPGRPARHRSHLELRYQRPGAHGAVRARRATGASGASSPGRESPARTSSRLVRFDSTTSLQSRAALENRWSHFASYDALSDSVGDEGGKLERGPVRLDLGADGPVAYQSHFVRGARGSAVLSWISVAAAGERLGAGRTPARGLEQSARRLGAGDRRQRPGHPAGGGAALAGAGRFRAAQRGLGRVRTGVARPARSAGTPLGGGEAMSLLPPGGRTSLQRVLGRGTA